MAGLWKKRGSWYLRPGGRDVKAICLGPVSAAEANRVREEVERRLSRGLNLVPGLYTFGEILERWLAEKAERRAPRTLRTYRTHASHFLRLFPCARRVGDLRAEDVAAYVRARLAEAAAAGRPDNGAKRTADKELTTLSMIFQWAVDRELAERNPCRAVERFGVDGAERPPAPAELVAELVRVLRAEAARCDRRDQAAMRELVADLVEVLWWTGWRIGEATRILVGEVNLIDECVTIRAARVKGGRVKSYPIAPEALPIVRARCEGKDVTDHVFGLHDSTPAGTRGGASAAKAVEVFRTRWLAGRLPGFGPQERFRPAFFHALRHAYATDLERAGVDPLVRQALTRHRTVRMLDHYSHRGLEALRAAQARLSRSRRRSRRPGAEGP